MATVAFILLLSFATSISHARTVEQMSRSLCRIATSHNTIGSGVCVAVTDDTAYYLTCQHVVDQLSEDQKVVTQYCQSLTVQTFMGGVLQPEADAKVVYRTAKLGEVLEHDIAQVAVSLRLMKYAPVPVTIAPGLPSPGETLEVFGCPNGGNPTAYAAITCSADNTNVIFSPPARQGRSGGPILYQGQLLALVTANRLNPATKSPELALGTVLTQYRRLALANTQCGPESCLPRPFGGPASPPSPPQGPQLPEPIFEQNEPEPLEPVHPIVEVEVEKQPAIEPETENAMQWWQITLIVVGSGIVGLVTPWLIFGIASITHGSMEVNSPKRRKRK